MRRFLTPKAFRIKSQNFSLGVLLTRKDGAPLPPDYIAIPADEIDLVEPQRLFLDRMLNPKAKGFGFEADRGKAAMACMVDAGEWKRLEIHVG